MIATHTFCKGMYKIWADRVPVVHGRVNLFTLWDTGARLPEPSMLVSGVTIHGLRKFIKSMTKDAP